MNSVPLDERSSDTGIPERDVSLTAFVIGLTSMATQVVLLRELISVFYGNELVIGVMLANWMALTGVGALLGRRVKQAHASPWLLRVALPLIGILPALTVALLRYLRPVVFPVGTMVDLVSVAWSSLLLLMPYCLLAGYMFTTLAAAGPRTDRSDNIAAVYGAEAAGSFAGGIVFSLLLAFVLNAMQVAAALFAVNTLTALFLVRERPVARTLLLCGLMLFFVPAAFIDLDIATRQFLFPGQHLLSSRDSPYGNVTVTEQSGQLNFFENNVLLSSTQDVAGSEEPVHYAMAQRRPTGIVLMISGTVSDAPREALKYGIQRLDYVDMNPLTVETARLHTQGLNDTRVRVVNEDARIFLRSASALYDAVLLNVGEPSTVQLNRFYTAEFFESLKARMNPHAVVSIGMLSATDYQSDDARRMNSTIANTLRAFFRHVLVVPGQRTYMLASDSTLDIRIGRLVRQSGIATRFVNEYYLDDQDLERRSRIIEGTLDPGSPVNRDFTPVAYYIQMVHWLSYFRSNIWILGVIALALVALTLRRVNAVSAGLLSGGFAASCIEVLILIAFQTLCGYVYQMLGIIITVFMGGLALGAMARRRIIRTVSFRTYALAQFGIALYSLLLALLFLIAGDGVPPTVALIVFPLLTFVIAVLVGLEFSIAASLRQGETSAVASELYAVDLIGSAAGALLVTTVLIPLVGLIGVCLIVALLTALTSSVALLKSTTQYISG